LLERPTLDRSQKIRKFLPGSQNLPRVDVPIVVDNNAAKSTYAAVRRAQGNLCGKQGNALKH
jgi:hypothetical protein